MLIRIEDILEPCQIILSAVDVNDFAQVTKLVELDVKDSVLSMAVTNQEYVAQIKIPLDEDVEFHATVDAQTFLKLICSMTCDVIEFTIKDNVLIVKGNGVYKLPLVFDGDTMFKLPEIVIDNVQTELDVDGNVLNSLLTYNSRQFTSKSVYSLVNKYYYMDENGAITFTSGACVNSFSLSSPIKMLLNQRLVKLFKLFKESAVHIAYGNDVVGNDVIQSKAIFSANNIKISSILTSDSSLINNVPVTAIRAMAEKIYPYSVNIDKAEVMASLNRLQLFANKNMLCYAEFNFKPQNCVVTFNHNVETIYYNNADTGLTEDGYKTVLDMSELQNILSGCIEPAVSVRFGDNKAVVIARKSVVDIMPEVHEVN